MNEILKKLIKMISGKTTTGAMFWFVVTTFLVHGIAFITTPIYTRLLSQTDYGIVSVYTGWYNILLVVFTMSIAAQAFGKGLIDFKENESSFCVTAICTLIITLLIGTIIYVVFEKQITSYAYLSRKFFIVMFSQAFATTTFSLWQIREVYNKRFLKPIVFNILYLVVNNAVTIIVLSRIPTDRAFIKVLFASTFEYVFSIIVLTMWIREAIVTKGKFNCRFSYFLFSFCLPLLPYYLMQQIINYFARFVIVGNMGEEKAAIFSLGNTIVNILLACWTAINNVYMPWLFRRLKDEKTEGVSEVNSFFGIGFMAITIGVVLLAPEVTRVLAPSSYDESVLYVPALTAGGFALVQSRIVTNINMYKGRTFSVSLSAIVSGIINIFGNIILIPKYGLMVGAYISFISYFVMYIINYLSIRKLNLDKLICFNRTLVMVMVLIALSLFMPRIYGMFIIRIIFVVVELLALVASIPKMQKALAYLNE